MSRRWHPLSRDGIASIAEILHQLSSPATLLSHFCVFFSPATLFFFFTSRCRSVKQKNSLMDTLMREEKWRPKVSDNHDWSKLCPDVLRKIIESLNCIDYHRAKTVCSDWYSVWKTCVKRPLYPWRIIYHYQDDSLSLFDPQEDKVYDTKLLGLSDKSYFMASSKNWLLMVDCHFDFYIFNLLTCERINLPSMKSSIRGGEVRFERNGGSYGSWGIFVKPGRKYEEVSRDDIRGWKRSAVFWIDDKTGDYLVAWMLNNRYIFTHKKGDDSWWNLETNSLIMDLAYKKSKLYLYTILHYIKIIDFSGDFPKEVIDENPYRHHPFHYHLNPQTGSIRKRRIAIQKSGEVLIILSLRLGQGAFFYTFKMNLESKKWERVYSIGDDEMLIFGHGVTIRAPVQDLGHGYKSGSIFFVKADLSPASKCYSNSGVFDLATGNIGWSNSWKSQWVALGF